MLNDEEIHVDPPAEREHQERISTGVFMNLPRGGFVMNQLCVIANLRVVSTSPPPQAISKPAQPRPAPNEPGYNRHRPKQRR